MPEAARTTVGGAAYLPTLQGSRVDLLPTHLPLLSSILPPVGNHLRIRYKRGKCFRAGLCWNTSQTFQFLTLALSKSKQNMLGADFCAAHEHDRYDDGPTYQITTSPSLQASRLHTTSIYHLVACREFANPSITRNRTIYDSGFQVRIRLVSLTIFNQATCYSTISSCTRCATRAIRSE